MIAMVIVGEDMPNLDDIKAMKMRGKSKKKMKAKRITCIVSGGP